MAFVRLVIFGFLFLSVIYISLSLYSRSLRREKLENRWAEDHPDDDNSPARTAFIAEGMKEYENGLRKKLILLVYIVPAILVTGILIVTNSN